MKYYTHTFCESQTLDEKKNKPSEEDLTCMKIDVMNEGECREDYNK